MRPDFAGCSITSLNLIGHRRIEHPNGVVTEATDYSGYRVEDKAGKVRVFLQLRPGDLSVDWLEISDKTDQFIIAISGPVRTIDKPE